MVDSEQMLIQQYKLLEKNSNCDEIILYDCMIRVNGTSNNQRMIIGQQQKCNQKAFADSQIPDK